MVTHCLEIENRIEICKQVNKRRICMWLIGSSNHLPKRQPLMKGNDRGNDGCLRAILL